MEIHEAIAGLTAALFMLPTSIAFSYIFKFIITPTTAAKIISFIASVIYLAIGPSPVAIAWDYQIINIVGFSHGLFVYLIIYWLVGFALVCYGIHLSFKSSNKAFKRDTEKAPRPLT